MIQERLLKNTVVLQPEKVVLISNHTVLSRIGITHYKCNRIGTSSSQPCKALLDELVQIGQNLNFKIRWDRRKI